MRRLCALFLAAGLVATPGLAAARTVCTLLEDADTGVILKAEGDCATRVTPASTFKIALSLMGFDSGFLIDAHHPSLPFKAGYADWLPAWRQTTDPARWIQYSVVWYSQQVTAALGEKRFQAYADAFDYGDRDLSGDPGRHNGLTRSWIGSSLKISPLEQAAFLRKLVLGTLPVSQKALRLTAQITRRTTLINGYAIHGKTGSSNPHGWFVGWATKPGAHSLIFVRLTADEGDYAGPKAREAMLKELPEQLPKP